MNRYVLLASRAYATLSLLLIAPMLLADVIVLPEPLSLEFALNRAIRSHPDIDQVQALRQRYQAQLLQAESNNDLNVNLVGTLRAIDPARFSLNRKNNDSRIGLFVQKTLYDFGRSEALIHSSELMIDSQQLQLQALTQQRLLTVVEAYFNVVLADMTYIRDNEAMSINYVSFEKVRDAHELHRVSDLALLRAENQYQTSRTLRYQSELNQRRTRSQLALLLNVADALPDNIELPVVGLREQKKGELEPYVQRALDNNPLLKALRTQLQATRQKVVAASNKYGPTLDVELSAEAFVRETNSTHPLSGQLQLDIPLYSGQRTDAEVAWARSEVSELNAQVAKLELDIRQQLLDSYLDIEQQNISLQQQDYLLDMRDLELDQSRALYEMEVSTDLGDAMVNISATRLQQTIAEMKLTLAWLRLKALTGELSDVESATKIIAGDL